MREGSITKYFLFGLAEKMLASCALEISCSEDSFLNTSMLLNWDMIIVLLCPLCLFTTNKPNLYFYCHVFDSCCLQPTIHDIVFRATSTRVR